MENSISINSTACMQSDYNVQKLTYTIPQVSEILNISVSQAYKLANMNAFPTIRLGKRVLVSVKKLEEFINR